MLVLALLTALALLRAAPAQPLPAGDYSAIGSAGLEGGGGLLALLARHGALDGHALARKSVRSPSRRLRFGRRSDPALPPFPPMSAEEWMLPLAALSRDSRTPLRLRFGRRAAPPLGEYVVPHVFADDATEEESREARSPTMRLRFGRSDPGLRLDETAAADSTSD